MQYIYDLFFIFGVAQDYKTIGHNNKGPNTGGMGDHILNQIVIQEVCNFLIDVYSYTISYEFFVNFSVFIKLCSPSI